MNLMIMRSIPEIYEQFQKKKLDIAGLVDAIWEVAEDIPEHKPLKDAVGAFDLAVEDDQVMAEERFIRAIEVYLSK